MNIAETENELEELETRSERLRALYEQYFLGIEKLEPQIQRKDVERRIHTLRKEQIRNTGLRFRFQMLVQRFNTLQQYWGRITREIENGTYRRDVVRAAMKFGAKEALTILGKKRARQYERLVAAQEERLGKRQAHEEVEEYDVVLEDDLTEAEEVDENPTPPRMSQPPASNPYYAQPPPSRPAPASQPGIIPTASAGGLRLGVRPRITSLGPRGETPSGVRSVDAEAARRRVAELAAQMQGPRQEVQVPGSLDLDFDDSQPPRRKSSTKSLRPPMEQPPPSQPVPPSKPQIKFGQIALTDDLLAPSPSSAAPTPPPPAPRPPPKIEPAQPPPPARAPRVQPAQAVVRPPSPSQDGSLADQRIRQIYAKYVETKRAANESTAGITFDKLAASLRSQTEKLRAQHPKKQVDYEVILKEGKTVIKPILR